MANIGEVIENPVTGERAVFIQTAQQTNGASCAAELTIKPHGFVSGEHIHPKQEETFEVTKGTLRFRIDGKEADAQTGQVVVVPVGTLHSWWNATDEEVVTIVSFRPALKSETFFETFFGLARAGKTDKQGKPKLLQAAVLFRTYRDEIQFPVPLPVRMLLTAIVPLAWLLGYRATYPEYTNSSQRSEARRPVKL